MFRKTDTNPQLDLFTAPSNILPKRAQKKYTDEKAWHNQFFKLVTSQIDEESFRPLFEETKMGAPDASIRILVAMSILKEGFGCSDEDLFEKCEFDLLARKALGLEMLDDMLPSRVPRPVCGREGQGGTERQAQGLKRQPPETDNLKVTDTETGDVMGAIYVGESKREGKHWRVNLSHVKPTHPWRYFNEEEVRRSELRRKIESLPIEEQNKRNNIEAAMFQYSFHTRNGKTRYRGLFRHRLQAFHRCMWMNLRRLVLFQTTINQRPLTDAASALIGEVHNRIYRLIEAISDPIKVFREYSTLLADISVLSVLKIRISVSEQMFNSKATF